MLGATIDPCDNYRPATRWGLRVVRLAAGFLLGGACLLAAACAKETSRQIALGQDVEIGPYALKVVGARDAPNPPPPLNSFRDEPGKKCIVVFVRWTKLQDGMDAVDRQALIESFLENQLSVADGAGRQAAASRAMRERMMYMEDPGANWWDWIVLFYVPDESRDLAVTIENPEPREDQARRIAVPLGM